MKLTIDQTKAILKNRTDTTEWYSVFEQLLPKYEINTKLRIAGFLSQCQHESYNFKRLEESFHYSADRLKAVFRSRVAGKNLEEYIGHPQKIANLVYANILGNGPEESGDGWKYRGQGVIQLTGKWNFEQFAKHCDITLDESVEYIHTKKGACHAACFFWDMRKINRAADEGSVRRMTKLVNGGYEGLEHRDYWYKRALDILD